MSRRLFFLLPDTDSCKSLVSDLEEHGVPERHLHVVASLNQSLDGLPEAGITEKTEMIHGIERGLGLGGAAGLLGGILAVTFPPAGLVLGGGALLAGTVAGAGFGAVVSSLLKAHEHNHDIDRFENAIEQGQLLLMVDIPKTDVEKVQSLILKHHPEAEIGISELSQGQ